MLKQSIQDIWIITNYNLYESKRYFSAKLAEALKRRGVAVRLLDVQNDNPQSWAQKNTKLPDLCCSFHRTPPSTAGKFFWDEKKIPFWSILVDPAFYDLNLTASPLSLLSSVDQNDLELWREKGFTRGFFWPHGVEKELEAPSRGERPYDVVFFGSCYDPVGLRKAWKQYCPPPVSKLVDQASKRYLEDPSLPFWSIVKEESQRKKMELSEVQNIKVCQLVDFYTRGVDRFAMLRAIKDARVHIFGGTCWREELPIQGWGAYFPQPSNIVLHPAVSYQESLEILKQSKICLNSSPMFKRGTHERIFNGLMCGCAVVTTENGWISDNFSIGEEISVYRPRHWEGINEQINDLLAHPEKLARQAAAGRAKVLQHHTWDHRVEELLHQLAVTNCPSASFNST